MNTRTSLVLKNRLAALGLLLASAVSLRAQVAVGAGGYVTTVPPGQVAPQATVYKSYSGPAATHKFFTAQNWVPLTGPNGFTMFPQPLSMQTVASGLALGYSGTIVNGGTYFIKGHQQDMILGTPGLSAGSVNISAYSDWTATFNWGALAVTVGRGMPFVYATTTGTSIRLTFPNVPTVFSTNANVLGVTINGNNYALFGPTGATWSGQGSTAFTCTLPSGKGYFSLALLPSQAALGTYQTYAFSFPTDTRVTWNYNPSTSAVTSTYAVTTTAKEGSASGTVMALYPHHYDAGAAVNTSYSYASNRGPLKVTTGSSFTTTDTYRGVVPFLPPVGAYNAATMQTHLNTLTNEGNHFSYNETYGLGKQLARVAHVMPIAKALGTTASLTSLASLQSSLESKFQTWFTASASKSSEVFYYDNNWKTLIGYPASYGSNDSLNDHHFHYGYWIHAAAILGMFDPTWASTSNWGGMVDQLIADIATPTRGGAQYPFLRHFDVYEGHAWASGKAPFGDGGNEESSSESMNAWAGIILWATQKGNTQLRDAAIWMYVTQASAIQHYWFNYGATSTFPSGFGRVQVANVFDGKSDFATWFGAQPEYSHGIEFLPFTGGSNYLGYSTAYCQKNLAEVLSLTGQSAINPSVTLWPDMMEMYEAYYNPSLALSQWNATSSIFDGDSKAHQYYTLTGMVAMGAVDTTVTANTPLYAVYRNAAGTRTHVAYNAGTSAISVTFSDGYVLTVPAGSLASDTTIVTTSGGTTPPNPPAAPTNLAASTASSSQINLTWTASTTSGVTYSVYRSTTSGFTPSSSNQVASGLTTTSYASTGLSPSTTYYFVVAAVNSAGSANSTQASATTSAGTAPAAPTNLTATTISSSQINLAWTGSTTSGVTYSVYRSTTSGFTPSSSTLVASGVSATSYANTGLVASTTYYFVVAAVNASGAANSAQASATTSGGTTTTSYYINCGGAASGTWIADTKFSGGNTASTTAAINTSALNIVPPQAVLQTNRWGACTYTLTGLTAGRGYSVGLFFAESYWSAAGRRRFNVLINGTQVLTNFDIFAVAGARHKATVQWFNATANASGNVVIQFTNGTIDNPQINGIVVY